MVGYIKGNFFVRYRSFESWAHLDQLADKWLAEEADPRLQGTVKEVVVECFEREKPSLKPLPKVRYDTSYYELRRVAWDGHIDVRGQPLQRPGRTGRATSGGAHRSREPAAFYQAETLVATHTPRSAQEGWSSIAAHHVELWNEALKVERRSLAAYEEVS